MITDAWLYVPFILLSLTVLLLAYAKISLFDKSWLNCITVPVGFSVLTTYLFEIIRITYFGHAGYSFLSLLFCYSLTPAYFWGLAAAYSHIRVHPVELEKKLAAPPNLRLVSYLSLAAAWLMFIPVIIRLAQYGLNPRSIYTHIGETDLGTIYFLSSALARVSLIAFILIPGRSRVETVIFCGLAIANVVMHGSQGQIISLIAIGIFLSVYVTGKRFRFWTVFAMPLVAASFLAASMYFLFSVGSTRQAMETISAYSDYVGDSAALIDRGYAPQLGWVTLQDNLIAHVPRLLWADKPQIFGLISVSASVRPFEAAMGYYPAFLFGEECADFGLFALPVVLIEGFFAGLIMRACGSTLQQRRSPFATILFLYFSGGALLSLGVGSTFIDQCVLAIIIHYASSIRLFDPGANRRPALLCEQTQS